MAEPAGDEQPPPLVISGVGGSGTRAFARIMRLAGIYIGTRLNPAEDTLDLRAFGRRWAGPYIRAMREREAPNRADEMRAELEQAVARHRDGLGDPRAPWGWKQPRSIHFLPLLHELFPGLKFLHVLRDGRDVAFGKIHALVWVGDDLLGPDRVDEEIPLRMIRFWAAANVAAADYGECHLGPNYLAVRLEDLCVDPPETVSRMLAWALGDRGRAQPSPEMLAEVEVQPTLGRWRRRDPEVVRAVERNAGDALRRFGY